MAVATKVDMKKEMKELYRPSSRTVSLVNVPAMNYLMIDGKGDPNDSPQFISNIEAIYSVAYGMKNAARQEGFDFTVMPFEAVYWSAGRKTLNLERRETWRWTVIMALPPQIKKAHFNKAIKTAAGKKDMALLSKVRFERMREGKCVEMMHLGPYSEEGRTIEKLISWARDNGFRITGKHHEIYMSDPRRTAPAKLRTIVRYAVLRK